MFQASQKSILESCYGSCSQCLTGIIKANCCSSIGLYMFNIKSKPYNKDKNHCLYILRSCLDNEKTTPNTNHARVVHD